MLRSNLQPPTPTMQDMEIIAQDMKAFKGQFKLDKFGFDPKMLGHATEHKMIVRQQPRTVNRWAAASVYPLKRGRKWPCSSMSISVP